MMEVMGMAVAQFVEALEEMGVHYLHSKYADGDGEFEFEYDGVLYSVGYSEGVVDEMDSESADYGEDE